MLNYAVLAGVIAGCSYLLFQLRPSDRLLGDFLKMTAERRRMLIRAERDGFEETGEELS